MNLMGKHSDVVEMACRSNLTNSYCSGIIGTTPGGLVKRPSYHVMKLYADHAKPIPLFAGRPAEGLDVLICADEKIQRVCVFAVNLRREPVVIRLDGPDVHSFEAVLDTEDRRQPDVMNHADKPNRVRPITQ